VSELTYLDFDLLIERTQGGYRARVLDGPVGQASCEFALPFSPLELENFLLRIGRSGRGRRRIQSPETDAAKAFGGRLFEAVFAGDVRGCLRSSLDEANRQGAGLRLRLRLADAPELVDLPWEFLYNAGLNRFLALSNRTPIVRYLDLPERIRPLAVTPPIRILAMISSPSDYPTLEVDREWSTLRSALEDLEGRGLVAIERMQDATLGALQRRLREGVYHVFHFIGHGGFDQQAQDGLLVLEDEAGRGRPVGSQFIGTLLQDHRSLRLAILNACEGARASTTDPFAGTAQCLVQQGIPAVIAMQFEITDQAAIAFSREFYRALAVNFPVDAALAEARKAIFAEDNDVEWGTPVLYLRAPDGRVFDVAQTTAAVGLSTPAETRPGPAADPAVSSSAPAVDASRPTAAPGPRLPQRRALRRRPFLAAAAAAGLALLVAIGALVRTPTLPAASPTVSAVASAPSPTTAATAPPSAVVFTPSAVAPTPVPPATALSTPPRTSTASSVPTPSAQPSTYRSALGAAAGAFVFSVREANRERLFVADLATGAAPRPLASGPGDEMNPACSPDGRELAFQANHTGAWRVYRVSLAGVGGDARPVTRGPGDDVLPVWRPDGQAIAFSRSQPGSAAILLLSLSGLSETRLTPGTGGDWRMSYSPDGQRIVFTSTRSGNNDLWTMNADGTGARQLTSGPADDRDPAWSPDGKWIAFVSDRGGTRWDLYRISPEGGAPVRLTADPSDKGFASWSPDSESVLFTSDRSGEFQVYRTPWSGGDWIQVTRPPLSARGPALCR
jgi:CHAT domain/WD40-like Beta Propeller Repeat